MREEITKPPRPINGSDDQQNELPLKKIKNDRVSR